MPEEVHLQTRGDKLASLATMVFCMFEINSGGIKENSKQQAVS